MPSLFLSAGDVSGDQHAARLVQHLRAARPDIEVEALGGPALAAAGVPLHEDLVSRAIIGILPAAAEVPRLLGLLRRVAGLFDERRPDLVVVVDYPGLNLYVARLAHRRGIPVLAFIAPQLWAWAPWRVARFARVVDEALVLFPFEQRFFGRAGIETHHVGHPVLDGLPASPPLRTHITDLPCPVALLPGSRRREVAGHMPLLLGAARRLLEQHPETSFHSAHVDPVRAAEMARWAERLGVPLTLHGADVHGVMASCRCAAVASGTATLETAALGTPLVALYRLTRAEELMRRTLLVSPWVSLVNLAAGEALVPELLAVGEDPEPLARALEPLLHDGPARSAQLAGLQQLSRSALARGAVARAAERVLARLA